MPQGFSHLPEGSGKKVSPSCPRILMAKYMLCLFGCCFAFKTSESEHKWIWAEMKSKAAAQKMLSGYPLFS